MESPQPLPLSKKSSIYIMQVHSVSQLKSTTCAWMQQEQHRYTSSRSGISTNQDEENKRYSLKVSEKDKLRDATCKELG
jgi:hypothetical protein